MTSSAIITPISGRIDATPARAAAPAAGKLRLTRRGRIVFGGLATVLVAAALAFAASFLAPGAVASAEQSSQQFPYMQVQAGDTLWGIAASLDPAADTRNVVSEIVRLNQLESGDLVAGQSIAVPLRFAGAERTF